MPILVIRDGVHAPHGGILLNQILAYITTGALVHLLHPNHLLACT